MLNSRNSKVHGGIPQYPQNMGTGLVSSTGAQGNTMGTNGGFSTYGDPALKGPRPFDLKKACDYDIEVERFKIQQMENKCRGELEIIRQDHQKFVENQD